MSEVDSSRRALFRGQVSTVEFPLRPPWSGSEEKFIRDCTRCGDCIQACPQKVLKVGSGGFPELDVSLSECTFCEQCVDVCEPGALVLAEGEPPWRYVADIHNKCLTYAGVHCRSCDDACEPRAIRFPLQLGAVASPVLDQQACTGCGACISGCPVSAISLISPD